MKIGLIVLSVLILLAIIITAESSGDKDDSPSVTSGSDSAQNSDSGTGPEDANAPDESDTDGVSFKGRTDKDTSANAGDTITKDSVATTSSPLVVQASPFGDSLVCTTVTIVNQSDKQISFNSIDWNLQDPNGASEMSTFSGSNADLSAGKLAPGGQKSGDVCFDGNPAQLPGEYVVINDGFISFSSARLAWANQL